MNNESECFTGISKHEKTMYENTRKQCMKTRENNVWKHEREARVFSCFRVFGYPGETLALVVYMASQMNRGVTECFRLLIWIEFLTKHNVIKIFDENTSDFHQVSPGYPNDILFK
jgi:hypothetical protein